MLQDLGLSIGPEKIVFDDEKEAPLAQNENFASTAEPKVEHPQETRAQFIFREMFWGGALVGGFLGLLAWGFHGLAPSDLLSMQKGGFSFDNLQAFLFTSSSFLLILGMWFDLMGWGGPPAVAPAKNHTPRWRQIISKPIAFLRSGPSMFSSFLAVPTLWLLLLFGAYPGAWVEHIKPWVAVQNAEDVLGQQTPMGDRMRQALVSQESLVALAPVTVDLDNAVVVPAPMLPVLRQLRAGAYGVDSNLDFVLDNGLVREKDRAALIQLRASARLAQEQKDQVGSLLFD